MTSATMRLIEAVERLNMSGVIGDGMVATLHDLAAGARLEQNSADVLAHLASKAGRLEPMRHRCETCGTVDGHTPGCAENESCRHPWHDFPCPNSWGSICPGCGEAG